MNEVKETLSQCLMKAWKNGWPEYCEDPAQDHAIVKLAEKIADSLKINIDDEDGYKRVCIGITRAGTFCRNNVPWCFKNVYYANMCFSTLYNHMKSVARLKKIRSQDYNYEK